MSVLLPTTTVRVLSPQQTLDLHGHATNYAWEERGPFPAAITTPDAQEVLTDLPRNTYDLRATIDPAAWPVNEADRLVDLDGGVYEVIGAVLRRDPSGGTRLDHVQAEVRRIVGAL